MEMYRLKYSNQWESDIYTVNDKRVTKLKEVVINGKWYKVTSRIVSVPYSDMGRPGAGTSTHYFVKEKVFGITIEFDLNTIVNRKPVYVSDYKVEE